MTSTQSENHDTGHSENRDTGIGRELLRLLRQPLVLAALLLQALSATWLLRGQLDNYLALQAGGVRNLSVGNDLLTPVLGVLAALLLLTAPLLAAAMRSALQAPYRRLSAARNARWLLPTLLVGSGLLLAVPVLLLLQLALLKFASALSLWLLCSAGLGLLLLGLSLLWLSLWLALQVRALAAALALGYLAMALVAALELQTLLPTPLGLFRSFRDGAIAAAGTLFYLLLLLALWRLLIASRYARVARSSRLLTLLLLGLAVGASWLPWRWQPQSEATLSPAEQISLQSLPNFDRLLAVSADPERRRDYIAALQILKVYHSKLEVGGVHPDELTAAERDTLPGREGLLISVAGQSAWLKLPTSDLARKAATWLVRLQRRSDQFLVFLEGHGERRLFGNSPRDFATLKQLLGNQGIRALSLQLQAGSSIPDNTSALVLASPTSAYLPDELRAIGQYLDRGGALLWLREPDEPTGFAPLEQALGVSRVPGTVLDLAGVQRGSPHPAIALVDHYPAHPALKGVTSLTALPWAAALQFTPSNGFTGQAILSSSSDSVIVSDANQTSVPLDAPRGAFTLGLALQRELGPKHQRVVVIGDGHFAADTAINNYGNASLAVALLQWLAFGEDAIAATDDRAADADLLLPPALLQWYRVGLPVLLPLLLLLGLGIYQWRWRRQ
ncbi:hypothetical protein HPT27_01260 [Permianibacter sp. IMCC34836]|uniref:Gldg family protein n=1 Tax=Permianibacter fluminis TaxID=2738515 RepID=UPI0015555585|nr:DUF4350 domain-containing protein [Permianibacter fluminis]NQD35630.1 hypothetical protein [Permianibacter fluminis]